MIDSSGLKFSSFNEAIRYGDVCLHAESDAEYEAFMEYLHGEGWELVMHMESYGIYHKGYSILEVGTR